MYDPSVGRWLSEDPIEFDGGDANLMRYVGNNPTNATDPSGLEAKKNGNDLFEEAGKRNKVPDKVIELIIDTATNCTPPPKMNWWEKKFSSHNECEQWADQFQSDLLRALSKAGYKNGLAQAGKGGIKPTLTKTVWHVPGSIPIFDPDQDHTAMQIEFKDGTVFYIDLKTISAMNVNLTNGDSHFGLPTQIPRSWEKYPRKEKPPYILQPGEAIPF